MADTKTEQILLLENLAIGYENGRALLGDLNLSVCRGEMVALIGRNGTGKSTLLKSMIGLLDSLQGTCYLEGEQLQQYSLRKRARIVSYVSSQVSSLPPISVHELVSLGRMPHTDWMGRMSEKDRKLVRLALEEVRMESLSDRRLDQLSDGEKQRVMIARALVQDTPLMVLDEPTAFLDIPNKYELISLLTSFRDRGKSVIYSTHDLETAMMCADRLWVIHEGKILEGSPEDLGISGIFNDLFQSSGITFDEDTRRFIYKESRLGTVQLTGEPENVVAWTRRALERLGFQVSAQANTTLHVSETNHGYLWELVRNKRDYSFKNIHSLARFLIKDN